MNPFLKQYYKKVGINGLMYFGLPVGVAHATGVGALFPYSALIAVGFLLAFGPILFSLNTHIFNNLPETIKQHIVLSHQVISLFLIITFIAMLNISVFHPWVSVAVLVEGLFGLVMSLCHIRARNKTSQKVLT